ncbi:uncharacterized protein LOC113562375 [Ooceraea biroi]|uniref:uncharacterized protein LOC113562375 n=1 Tax=Ooceraea biroi TaxID=2015173 RepID=UPI000F08CE9B|nr:uncharacterized protein LOC113562375 [Ooceraea biroi]
MNRKRPRKDISHISKRHLNRLAAEESKLICDSVLNTSVLSDNENYKNPEYLKTGSTNNSHNRYETFATENDSIYGQNNISIKCENEEYLELNESDSEQSSMSIYQESSQESLPYIAAKKANTTDNFKNSLAVWTTKHQISHTLSEIYLKD